MLGVHFEHYAVRRDGFFMVPLFPQHLGRVLQGDQIVRLQFSDAAQICVGFRKTLLCNPQTGQIYERFHSTGVDLHSALEMFFRCLEPVQFKRRPAHKDGENHPEIGWFGCRETALLSDLIASSYRPRRNKASPMPA